MEGVREIHPGLRVIEGLPDKQRIVHHDVGKPHEQAKAPGRLRVRELELASQNPPRSEPDRGDHEADRRGERVGAGGLLGVVGVRVGVVEAPDAQPLNGEDRPGVRLHLPESGQRLLRLFWRPQRWPFRLHRQSARGLSDDERLSGREVQRASGITIWPLAESRVVEAVMRS